MRTYTKHDRDRGDMEETESVEIGVSGCIGMEWESGRSGYLFCFFFFLIVV